SRESASTSHCQKWRLSSGRGAWTHFCYRPKESHKVSRLPEGEKPGPLSLNIRCWFLAADQVGQAHYALVRLGARRVLNQGHTGIPRADHGLGIVRDLPVGLLAKGFFGFIHADGAVEKVAAHSVEHDLKALRHALLVV